MKTTDDDLTRLLAAKLVHELDVDPATLVDNLPNWVATQGYSGCTGTGDGACLDDIAAYLYNDDIAPNEPGVQTVTTHTIGFAIDLPILQEAALRGGGESSTS